jgi:hypothetical protein
MLFCGAIPDGLWVLHKCDNPSCIRPDHLYVGTPKQNAADRDSRGRGNLGKPMPNRYKGPKPWTFNAKLTAEQVLEIRRLYAAGGISMHQLGRQFGINGATVHCIVHRKTWFHI